MKRFITAFALGICFLGWVFHRFFIKKDLRERGNNNLSF
jgi:hypothetical protein